MKKYSFTGTVNKAGHKQIVAEKSFGNIEKGDVGGYIEKESNLSHYGDSWVFENAEVFGGARIQE